MVRPACRQAGRVVVDKEYFVYIIKNLRNDRFYTGITDNLKRRLKEHFGRKGPFLLVHVEIIKNRIEARKVEKFFKTGFGREIRDEIMVVVAQQ